jgi:hypothetical protein
MVFSDCRRIRKTNVVTKLVQSPRTYLSNIPVDRILSTAFGHFRAVFVWHGDIHFEELVCLSDLYMWHFHF